MSSESSSRNSSGVAGVAVAVSRIACRLTTSSKTFLTARPLPNRNAGYLGRIIEIASSRSATTRAKKASVTRPDFWTDLWSIKTRHSNTTRHGLNSPLVLPVSASHGISIAGSAGSSPPRVEMQRQTRFCSLVWGPGWITRSGRDSGLVMPLRSCAMPHTTSPGRNLGLATKPPADVQGAGSRRSLKSSSNHS